jgi:transcriptional regulator GlxA family with amidase domain
LKVNVVLYHHCTATDLASAVSILARVPGFELCYLAHNAGPVKTDGGAIVWADRSFETAPPTDILVLPGSGKPHAALTDPSLLEWLRKLHARSKWTLSVCTGSLVLGMAGLLEGRRATTHWGALPYLGAFGAVAVKERVVSDGRLVTTAGVSAGVEGALALIEAERGAAARKDVERLANYAPMPPFDAGSPERASLWVSMTVRLSMMAAAGPAFAPLLMSRWTRRAA